VDYDNILLAFRTIKSNKGSHTAGVDNKDIRHLATLSPNDFVQKIRNKLKDYKPSEVRRVEIPKPNGKMRPLGIPTIEDRIIQQAFKQVLEPIAEAKFYEHSYGFRPRRSAKDAMKRAYFCINKFNNHYVVDIDIKGFFDNINHSKLIKQIWAMGIRDKKVISVIRKMLRAKIRFTDKVTVTPTEGTPQGGILSPLLSNIVLNELDWWIASQWELHPFYQNQEAKRSSNTEVLRRQKINGKKSLKEMHIVRYADDFKIFTSTYEEARKVMIAVTKWLKERLSLDISKNKSGIVKLRKSYSQFLGIEFKAQAKKEKKEKRRLSEYHKYSKVSEKTDKVITTNYNRSSKVLYTLKGFPVKWVHKSRLTLKAQNSILDSLKESFRKKRPPKRKIEFLVKELNSKILGWHNYYNMATRVNKNLNGIVNLSLRRKLYNRLRANSVDEPASNITNRVRERYGKSKVHYTIGKLSVLPIHFVQYDNQVLYRKKPVQIFDPKQKDKFSKLAFDFKLIKESQQYNDSNSFTTEYYDNRLSKYSGQKGKCGITGIPMKGNDIHCHHIKPKYMGGNDKFKNLICVHRDIHILLHTVDKNKLINGLKWLRIDKTKEAKFWNYWKKIHIA
jgi:group II intron reverse transcriptase/maturase